MENSYIELPNLVRPEIVAKRLGVSRNTVLNWSRTGKIPCVRIGHTYRYSMEKIENFLNQSFSFHK